MDDPKPTAFVVFTSPRTGSSWLVDLLDSHPRIAAYGELFLPGDKSALDYGGRDLPRFEATIVPRRRLSLVPSRLAYLRRLYAPRAGIDAVGFKLMYGHPEVHAGLLPYLAVRRARVAHLVRQNALEQVVSWEASVARNQFRAHTGDHVADVSVELDVTMLRERLAQREHAVQRARATLRRYRLPAIEVVYERLRVSPTDELSRIADFLGVEPTEWPQTSRLVRMNARPWRETVANAADVERELAGTSYGWMLE